MIRSYDITYLDDAMRNLGEAVDFASHRLRLSVDDFFYRFITSGYAEQFGNGNPKYVCGMTGIELVYDILYKTGIYIEPMDPEKEYYPSSEYWTGWILAYYQWYLGRSFKTIIEHLPAEDVIVRYSVLHEASEERCADAFNKLIQQRRDTSRLQKQRKKCNLSQKELADRAGVNLRTLQQYELMTKNLGKASAATVLNLSRVLYCTAEDLIEIEFEE